MKIIQLLTTLQSGDAVGSDALTIRRILMQNGYETEIYAQYAGRGLEEKELVKLIDKMPDLTEDDIMIYHLSTATSLNMELDHFRCRKICIYHNITPPGFFAGYSRKSFQMAAEGYRQLQRMSHTFDACITDSEYNKEELVKTGFSCPVHVIPIRIQPEDKKKSSASYRLRFSDGRTNLLFVGRISPNKCQHDLITVYTVYKRLYDDDARLILAGGYKEEDTYYQSLKAYQHRLGLADEDVVFTGHIEDDELLACYQSADVFLCMSEHEGFCVPLVEAMCFNLPILAYKAAAIPETLGNAGLLFDRKEPSLIAAAIDRVVKDKELAHTLAIRCEHQLLQYSYENVSQTFMQYLENFIRG